MGLPLISQNALNHRVLVMLAHITAEGCDPGKFHICALGALETKVDAHREGDCAVQSHDSLLLGEEHPAQQVPKTPARLQWGLCMQGRLHLQLVLLFAWRHHIIVYWRYHASVSDHATAQHHQSRAQPRITCVPLFQ
jgi:hypothetical protein